MSVDSNSETNHSATKAFSGRFGLRAGTSSLSLREGRAGREMERGELIIGCAFRTEGFRELISVHTFFLRPSPCPSPRSVAGRGDTEASTLFSRLLRANGRNTAIEVRIKIKKGGPWISC